MDIKEFADELCQRMLEKLDEVQQSHKEQVVKESSSIEIVKSHTYELKSYLYQYEFKSKEEQIEFFKDVKPRFVGLLIFHNELFEIEVSKPLEKDEIVKHYLGGLHKGQTFINANMEFYKYYHLGSTYLDSKYFLPDKNRETGSDVIYDSRFCTPYDHKFCMFKAYEMLKEYLTRAIERASKPPELEWTASKISLIELIYAFHASGVFNKSNTDVKEIATYFEKVFCIDLGNYYRVLRDIQARKNGKTFFLDELKGKLKDRLGEPGLA